VIPPPLEEPVQVEEEVEELVEVSPPEPEEEVVEDVKCCGGDEVTTNVLDYVAENADANPLLAAKLGLQVEEVVEE